MTENNKNKNLFVEVHALQPLAASNINRDENGMPKTVIYGGSLRSRVSSQAWKRAMRESFENDTKDVDLVKSYRTKFAADLLANEICKQNSTVDSKELASKVFKIVGISVKEDSETKKLVTKTLIFISKKELEKLAAFALENSSELLKAKVDKNLKVQLITAFNSYQSIDLALFGRMLAENKDLTVEAATQVAHAFSTHAIQPEFDFFTALDDCNDSGAAMLDSMGFTAATLYRYANVNVRLLEANLSQKELVKQALKLFLKEFILSMPSGKQNSFASKTLPKYVLIDVRTDTPINLASAFEDPVKSKTGYLKKSAEKLEKENKDLQQASQKAQFEVVLNLIDDFESSVNLKMKNIDEMISKVVEDVDVLL